MTMVKSPQELLDHPKPKEVIDSSTNTQVSLNSHKPLSRLLNRVILFGAGAGLLAWGLSIIGNRVTSVTATHAFVNGKIITVTSPISGKVHAQVELDSGTPINSKQAILDVNESFGNSQWLQSLKLDLLADKAKLSAIEDKINRLSRWTKVPQPHQNLEKTVENYLNRGNYSAVEVAFTGVDSETTQTPGTVSVRLAEQNVKQAEIDLKVAQNHAKVAQSKYKKFNFLAKQGAISTFSVEEVLNNWKVSLEQVELAKVQLETAKIHRAEQQRLSLQRKPSLSRLQDVAVTQNQAVPVKENTVIPNPEFVELMRRKSDLQISIDAKEKTLAEANALSKNQKGYQVSASSEGVLWEVMVQDGEQVNPGQPLLKQLNCQQLWVDAFVHLDSLKRIEIGSPVQVELYANNVKLNGRVKTIRSSLSGDSKLGQDVAVNPPESKNQQLAQIRIELENPQELSETHQSSAQFCQVGQVAKVNITQGNSSLFANLLTWTKL